MRQSLKNNIPILRAVAMPAECSQREEMSCIVRKTEATYQTQRRILGVRQYALARAYQLVKLGLVGRLGLELSDFLQVLQAFLTGFHFRRLTGQFLAD